MVRHPHAPLTVETQHFQILERFSVILYDKTSSQESVNEARRELFCQKNRKMETIPPTQVALLQHTKRVAYQAGIWTTSNLSLQQSPSPEGCGWTLDKQSSSWLPVWTMLPLASKACTELVKCGCKVSKVVEQGVHARKQTGNVLNYVVAPVTSDIKTLVINFRGF